MFPSVSLQRKSIAGNASAEGSAKLILLREGRGEDMNKEALFKLRHNVLLAAQKEDNKYYSIPEALDNPKTKEERRQFFRGVAEAIEVLGLEEEYCKWLSKHQTEEVLK